MRLGPISMILWGYLKCIKQLRMLGENIIKKAILIVRGRGQPSFWGYWKLWSQSIYTVMLLGDWRLCFFSDESHLFLVWTPFVMENCYVFVVNFSDSTFFSFQCGLDESFQLFDTFISGSIQLTGTYRWSTNMMILKLFTTWLFALELCVAILGSLLNAFGY
jgi:hypothetical protein